jgi:hypothetical protein
MSSLEQSILEAVRTLSPDRQQEILKHAEKLRRESEPIRPRWSGKGLWADLNIALTADQIEEAQREMGKSFSTQRYLMPALVSDTHAVIWYLASSPVTKANRGACCQVAC